MKIVECVPNVSEGRRPEVYAAIAKAAADVPGVTVLDVDPGAETNRTVITFVGDPEAVLEGAWQLICAAVERIDMSGHQGAHARMGAVDVVPFVPVAEMTMEECAELARRLGERVGRELGVPVYLYEHAASSPQRRNLADVRAGEYEGLADKLADPAWHPDYGPAAFVPRSGATVIGARPFLVAYNVNLNTTSTRRANAIAFETFALLWIMRLSTKLNIFLGVSNASEDLLPPRVAYLKSYFARAPMNALFPVSITAATTCVVLLVEAALRSTSPAHAAVGSALLATFAALAVLEHWLLVLPLPASSFWPWAGRHAADEASQPSPLR